MDQILEVEMCRGIPVPQQVQKGKKKKKKRKKTEVEMSEECVQHRNMFALALRASVYSISCASTMLVFTN